MQTEQKQKKHAIGARPPKRLSQEAKRILAAAKPSVKAFKRVAAAVKLPVIDGADVGL
jgi:hypothetical protein